MPTVAPFRILAVCTGNICRSPMVERLLEGAFDGIAPGEFEISSAGTRALIGHPMDDRVATYVRGLGAGPAEFRARQLNERITTGQDLVLTLTREHRSQVIEISPSLLRKTFTLREFARLLPALEGDSSLDGPRRWREILPKAIRARRAHPSNPSDDDVIDPYHRPEQVYRQMASDLVPAVRTLVDWEYNHRSLI
jgi:protein-tyrosine phosphatase